MSWNDVQPFVEAVITLFAIMNPIYVLPIFNGLTSDVTFREQQMMFRVAAIGWNATVIVVGVLGEVLMRKVFGVGLGSLMVACGVMLVVVCVRNMISEGPTQTHTPPDLGPDSAASSSSPARLAPWPAPCSSAQAAS